MRFVDAAMVYDYMRDKSIVLTIPDKYFERLKMSGNYEDPGKPTPKKTPAKKKGK